MVRTACRVILMLALWPGSAQAGDLKTYIYDAQGRLIAVTRVTAGPGAYAGYSFDDADNRTQRIGGAAPLPAVPSELRPGEVMVPVQSLVSQDGRSTLQLQSDGNLVIYFGSTPLWGSGTGTGRSMVLAMQTDGNLVLYDPSLGPLWFQVFSQPGTRLVLQNDCNLVLINGSTPLWATGTSC